MSVPLRSVLLAVSAAALALTSCTAATPSTPPSPTPTPTIEAGGTEFAYTCVDGKSFELITYPGQERAMLRLEGKTVEVKQERSANGARYSNGTVAFVGSGLEATIEEGGKTTYRGCAGRVQ